MRNVLTMVSLLLVFTLFMAFSLWAAENGENKYIKVFETKMPDVDRTAWDVVLLPDLNDNGVDEVLVACDAEDGSGGADFYIYEREENNKHKVLWHYRAADCSYEYGASYGDADSDGLLEVMVCLRVSAGQNGLRFFEVDPTLPGYPLPTAPTSELDLGQGAGYSIDHAATDDLDKDEKNELIVLVRLPSAERGVWILQEQGGDIAFPDFKLEGKFGGFAGSPYSIVTGDFDNDGFRDLAVAEYDFSGIFIYENVEPDSYVVRFHYKMTSPNYDGVALRSLRGYDFNNDGFTELVYPTNADTGLVFIITNPGELADMDSTNVHPIATIPGGCAGGVVMDQDWTGAGDDGRDIYVAGYDSVLYDIEYIGGDAGDVGDPNNWVVYHALEKGPWSLQDVEAGDFDRDGRREVVAVTKDKGDPNTLIYVEHEPLPNFGVQPAWHDPNLPTDPLKGNPRGFWVGSDVDQDGKKEIFATQYTGKVVGYEVVGDNMLELIWVDSTAKAVGRGMSLPRHVVVGDIDNNGKQEIIFICGRAVADSPDSVGFYFFEWNGQDNGFGVVGGGPTYILPANQVFPEITDIRFTEHIWMADVDNDGHEEILFPGNGTGSARGADFFTIFSCVDGTLESGFPTFKNEFFVDRAEGGFGGSPVGAKAADVDGDGVKEAIFLPWDLGKMLICDAVKADSFAFRTVRLDQSGDDAVFYVSVGAYDVDGDGKDELMGAEYSTSAGRVILVNVPDGGVAALDPNDPSQVAIIREATGSAAFNNALGDLNGDGKAELFFCNYARAQVNSLAYNGAGDPTLPANWITSEGFYDDTFVPKPQKADYPDTNAYKEALDEWNDGDISQRHGSFGLKLAEDLDKDGKKELVISTLQSYWSKTWLWVLEATATGVEKEPWHVITPNDYKLSQNYPNPFNATTTIEFELPLDKQVKVVVYNSMGQIVRTLVDGFKTQGAHRVVWDGLDNSGNAVASGMYLYSLEFGSFKQVKSMTLLK